MNIKKTLLYLFITIIVLTLGAGIYLLITSQAQKKKIQLEKESRTEIEKQEEAPPSPFSSPRILILPDQKKTEKNSSMFLRTEDIEKKTYITGEPFNIIVIIDAKEEIVDGAEFLINYDSSIVEIGDLIFGEFFSLYPQKQVDNEKGFVRVIALQKTEENKSLGQGALVTLPVISKQKGTVVFAFDMEKTHIAGYGGQELLETAESLTIIFE